MHKLTIGIVGAGYSGTAMALTLHRLAQGRPLTLYLCERSGHFGSGYAYDTPYAYHLLNVRAKDMSAFEAEPDHFVHWLETHPELCLHHGVQGDVRNQFVPRLLYRHYLQALLHELSQTSTTTTIHCISSEVMDVRPSEQHLTLQCADHAQFNVDRVILATGNPSPAAFPFPIGDMQRVIANPWQYTALTQISAEDPVLIIGTGLSMIDAVLTLHHQQHRGPIYAVSRHGLLPLPHSEQQQVVNLSTHTLPSEMRALSGAVRQLCREHMHAGGDWRSVIQGLRQRVPLLWAEATPAERKRFLRHLLPYWNIHRHRVHTTLAALLADLTQCGQLQVIAGRVCAVNDYQAHIALRHTGQKCVVPVTWVINCMGPATNITQHSALIKQLCARGLARADSVQVGLDVGPTGALKDVNGNMSTTIYTIGPPSKAYAWESAAVPEIRQQCLHLARTLLSQQPLAKTLERTRMTYGIAEQIAKYSSDTTTRGTTRGD